MKLVEYRSVTGKLICQTGLRIGMSQDSFDIGGTDNPVVKHPITNMPYIPGSSIKGKIRSLIEQKHDGYIQSTGRPCNCGKAQCIPCKYFGTTRGDSVGPTRFLFRDCELTEESMNSLVDSSTSKGTGITELKSEVSIDRNTGRVSRSGPRVMERVPAGTEFDFRLDVRVFEGDDTEEIMRVIQEGLGLLKSDYLGGSGSRGYGKVDFRDLKVCVNTEVSVDLSEEK